MCVTTERAKLPLSIASSPSKSMNNSSHSGGPNSHSPHMNTAFVNDYAILDAVVNHAVTNKLFGSHKSTGDTDAEDWLARVIAASERFPIAMAIRLVSKSVSQLQY